MNPVDIFYNKPSPHKSLSLVIPFYNEENNLPTLIQALQSVTWTVPTEFIFVDDGSTDSSVALLEQYQQSCPSIQIIKKKKKEGKGTALKIGIEKAHGGILAIQDADLEYDPNELLALIQPILDGRADVVYGSRFKRDCRQVHRTFHMFANLFLTFLSNLFSGIYFSDMETCYKVFRADVLKSFDLKTRCFGFEPEVTAYIAKFRLRILEFPISYFPRTYKQGKKIRWVDGVKALWFIVKFNLFVNVKGCLTATALDEFSHRPKHLRTSTAA